MITLIKLEAINEKNYIDAFRLDVFPNQRNLVATNALSIAQAYVFRDQAQPFIILNDDIAVGFIMFEVSKEKDSYYIWRFMVDKNHQKKGYGKAAMILAFEHLKKQGAKEIKLSHAQSEDSPANFYKNAGFEYTGELDDGELVMKYIVK